MREWLGIDPAHVLVIGDGRNDVGMFRWALENGGRAVAMEQGPQEVRDAAGETTTSVQAGGVAGVAPRALTPVWLRVARRAIQDLLRRSWKNGSTVPSARLDACSTDAATSCPPPGGLSERPMDLVLKTSGQQCPVGSNPTPSASSWVCTRAPHPRSIPRGPE